MTISVFEPLRFARNAMLNHALKWAARGLPVFPLRPRSKIPFAGSNGCKDATRDEAIIRAWWRKQPRANIGVATGEGFFVLDLDGDEAQQWFVNSCGRHGEHDPTLTVKTASGWHLYFWAPVEIPNSISRIAPHVDIRGTGGYAVAPPSIHPDTGQAYEFVHDQPIAEAPRWLTDLAIPDPVLPRQSLSISSSVNGVAGIVALVTSARPGERNAVVFWAGCRFAEMAAAQILGKAYAEDLLTRAARSAGLPEREIAATVRSAFGGARR
jgi:hypothetical protein